MPTPDISFSTGIQIVCNYWTELEFFHSQFSKIVSIIYFIFERFHFDCNSMGLMAATAPKDNFVSTTQNQLPISKNEEEQNVGIKFVRPWQRNFKFRNLTHPTFLKGRNRERFPDREFECNENSQFDIVLLAYRCLTFVQMSLYVDYFYTEFVQYVIDNAEQETRHQSDEK